MKRVRITIEFDVQDTEATPASELTALLTGACDFQDLRELEAELNIDFKAEDISPAE